MINPRPTPFLFTMEGELHAEANRSTKVWAHICLLSFQGEKGALSEFLREQKLA